jgi:EpsD family peptidyl-prolyl cis-trans isomerase
VLLAACGGGSTGGKATQVAVKVNKDEITVLQVNEQLAHLPNGVSPEQLDPATRKILGSLVNQQLLVEQALERKLDRDPEVLGALESARLNILAEAYVRRVIGPQAKPTEQEVKKYYADNPSLFSERRIYRLQELVIDANSEQEKEIEATASHMKTLKQLAEYLHGKNLAFSADSGVRTAEQLPLNHLPQIAQLKPESLLVYLNPNNRVSAIEVMASESRPVDDKKAAPVIEQFLTKRKLEELSVAELKRLREASKVEYVGDYSKFASAEPAATAVIAPASQQGDEKGIAALR